MKTLEEAVLRCFALPKETRDEFVDLAIKNMNDVSDEALASRPTKEFLFNLAAAVRDATKKKATKRGLAFSLVLTGFLHGVRVGQEMEKR